ncbi:retrovirus-related gag-pol polyprotein [Plasmopara halstedii]|uniref:Retrovirus-related gag-pol polyprotein n=1 Tax=Plasmopara halstedii TaxID=4781 RepID=A0A0P1AG78_PLAHL|nr:retrovirus-related gag-pol polyprotein [Plasmopara halstedii]CEG39831.1 retrovirus-related gag-pol polyprotein [Plasmopara halstedii]|eukprot:XP_024576200.1 retrovirus-related gag-pol polyprotein [Plasmopara halstedii]
MERHFEKKSLANKLFIRHRLFAAKTEEGEDVLEHINKIKTLAEQLDAAGAPVSADDLVITLLANLSESYAFLITELGSRADSLSWELVTSRLLHEDLKRKEQGGGVDGAAHNQGQAFVSTGSGRRKGRQVSVKGNSTCHYCGEHGHWIATCPTRICENAERQRPQHANIAQNDDDFGDYCFSVGDIACTVKSSCVWLIDSGATQHMTYSKEYIKNYKKIAPIDVHLAYDGVKQAIGTGDIVMSMMTPRGMKTGLLTDCRFQKDAKRLAVFRVQKHQDREVERYKARLVAKRFAQKYGIDYEKTFASVAKFPSIRVLLSLSAIYGLRVHQLDVKTVLLNRLLEEDIFMVQPDGYVDKSHSDHVCKLKRLLYGIKQLPRTWNNTFDDFMLHLEFKKCESDHCVYTKRTAQVMIFVALYVDDLTLASSSINMLRETKQALSERFEMTGMGQLKCFFGMEIKQDTVARTVLTLQTKFAHGILEKFKMAHCKTVHTPQDPGLKLTKIMCEGGCKHDETMAGVPYRNAVGCLMDLMVGTRPDLAAAVKELSQLCSGSMSNALASS